MNDKAGILAGGALCLIGGAVSMALLASGCGSQGSTAATHATPAPTSLARHAHVIAPGIQQWLSSGGLSRLSAVEADTARIGDDAGSHDTAALSADGPVLRKDALAALALPYPGDSMDYQVAMGYLAVAGTDLEGGDFSSATTALDSASAYLTQVQAAMSAQGAS